METIKKILNEGNNKDSQKGGKINEGQERGNNKIVDTPKPTIDPAPQKPKPEPEPQKTSNDK